MNTTTHYEPIVVSIDRLLLDPNNPRCVVDLNIGDQVPDEAIESRQAKLLAQFDETDTSEFFSIKDLIDSFQTVGYVPIDKIVVRELSAGGFVVLEGNRRVSALKILKDRAAKGEEVSSDLLASMQSLPALRLRTEGLTPSQVQHHVSVLLGIRHHGSLLEWEPLPKAFNIFNSYMQTEPRTAVFRADRNRIKTVKATLSVSAAEVKKALKTYIAFQQLKLALEGVKDDHFSLIQHAVTNGRLNTHGFVSVDDETLELDDSSIERLGRACQFDVRDKLESEQKILPEPKSVGVLGRLVEKAHIAEDESVRSLAKQRLEEALSGELDPETRKLKISVESALNSVIDRESRTLWMLELDNLLEQQSAQLDPSAFLGEANDLLELEELRKGMRKVERILGL